MKILGIDPGIGRLGWGVVEREGRRLKAVDFGGIETTRNGEKPLRLVAIYDALSEVVKKTKPDVLAVEALFFSKNITTAMSVAEARGVVLLVAGQHKIPVTTFSPMSVKSALGFGGAKKQQVDAMVKMLLGIKEKFVYDDVADALAVAICASQQVKE
jgi:crossover junction endodeoxyribonuclease RuvC